MVELKEKKKKIKKCVMCKKHVVWEWGRKPSNCPYCTAIKWDKPHDEARLFNLQEKYLKSRNKDVLGEMFIYLKEYARRIILKNLVGHVRYDEITIEEKATDTANKLVEYFLEKPSFHIFESWGYYLDRIAKQNMFAKKLQRIDQNELSIEQFQEDHSENKNAYDSVESEYVTTDYQFESNIVNNISKDYIIDELMEYIQTIFYVLLKTGRSYSDVYRVFSLFSHTLAGKAKRFENKYFNLYGQEYQEDYEKMRMQIYEFLSKSRKAE